MHNFEIKVSVLMFPSLQQFFYAYKCLIVIFARVRDIQIASNDCKLDLTVINYRLMRAQSKASKRPKKNSPMYSSQ